MRPEVYVRIIARRWWLLPLIAATAAIVAYVVTDRQPRVFTSSAELIAIGEPPGYWIDLYAKNRLASYKKLITDSKVIGRAVELGQLRQRGLDTGAVMARLQVAHNPDTNTIQLAAVDTDPTRAAAVVNAVARAFVEQNDTDNQALQQEYQYPRDTTGSIVRIDRVRLVQLGEANVPGTPSAPRPKLNAAAAAILGLAVALVVAFVLEYLDDTLRTGADVAKFLALPLLAGVPATRPARGKHPAGVSDGAVSGQR